MFLTYFKIKVKKFYFNLNIKSIACVFFCLFVFNDHVCRYQGKEGWAPASYLKKSDVLSQKMSTHSSANDLDGACKQQNNNKENKENQRERFSPFNDKKSTFTSSKRKNSLYLSVCCEKSLINDLFSLLFFYFYM